ncbi:MAG: hypothetical protein AB7P53_14585, partial [Candidatus Dadabacteria bacterium]
FCLEHIPFYATNNSGEETSICCHGPWRAACELNASESCSISAGAVDYNFYTVDVDIFSPYGTWKCCLSNDVSDCSDPVQSPTPVECIGGNFTLAKGDTAVYLTFTEDSLTVSLDNPSDTSTTQARAVGVSDTSTTQANLGDDNTRPRRDRDTWSFQGAEGENVVITLEKVPESGNSGEQATLILQNGGSTIETSTAELPFEIAATLPSTGEYKLIVSQNDIPEDVRFRGRYYLSVKSSLGTVQDIKPSEDVEQ